jgi:hypothetical protein
LPGGTFGKEYRPASFDVGTGQRETRRSVQVEQISEEPHSACRLELRSLGRGTLLLQLLPRESALRVGSPLLFQALLLGPPDVVPGRCRRFGSDFRMLAFLGCS